MPVRGSLGRRTTYEGEADCRRYRSAATRLSLSLLCERTPVQAHLSRFPPSASPVNVTSRRCTAVSSYSLLFATRDRLRTSPFPLVLSLQVEPAFRFARCLVPPLVLLAAHCLARDCLSVDPVVRVQ